jgi:N-acetylglucosamine-6-phosphate deacetylase
MIVLAGGDIVLPDRVLSDGALVLDDDRIVAIDSRSQVDPEGATIIDARGCFIAPGLIDVHVHGVDGHDTLDGGDAVAAIARSLPRYGVTAFCPTTVACSPDGLRGVLDQVRRARLQQPPGMARVLPAHLESNFVNPEYRGAQPAACLRVPLEDPATVDGRLFRGRHILATMAASRPDVAIVTVAPELPGGMDLVRSLVAAGYLVSLGHSGADFDTAIAAIEAGARHATHLFNRMTPMTHRAPGLAGAVLAREDVAAELILDGVHVHPAISRVAIAAKGTGGIMAITDGTAGAGLVSGSVARLGGRPIHVRDGAVFLDDGTLAGSAATMDRVFANIVETVGRSVVDAAAMCATTPAHELALDGLGVIAEGATADVVVLDRRFRVVRTFIDGEEVYSVAGTS